MSKLSSISKIINEKNAEITALKEKYKEEFQESFKEITKAFFEECPYVQAIVWSQYTPYFNDGDPCTFRVNERYYITKNFDSEELLSPYEYEEDDYGPIEHNLINNIELAKKNIHSEYWSKRLVEFEKILEDTPHIDYNVVAEFDKMIDNNEELMEEIFGDHCSVYLTKNEIIVEEYSHD